MAALKFILAVANGDLEAVQLFLNKPENSDLINYCGDDENTPLIYACANGHENIVRYLISRGARLTAALSCNTYGWTPLMVAAYYGHCQIVSVLLQSISDYSEGKHTNRLCATALQCAARCNHIQVAKLLLSKGAEVNSAQTRANHESQTIDNRSCRSPLMAAVQHGHDEMASLLISQGSDVNFTDRLTGWTSLMLAAFNGHKTAVTILLKNGANCNVVNTLGQNALDIARKMRRKDIENELEPVTARQDPGKLLVMKIDLIEAVKEGNLKQIQELSKQSDFDVNENREDGMTPLMWTASKNQFRVALFLIKKGADVNLRDNPYGWTALMHAINSNHKSIICLLILNGANIQLQSHDKTTPFDRATIVGDKEVIRILGAANNINEAEVFKQNSSWSYLVKSLQQCLWQDQIDMTVSYNSTSKELQLLDLSDNNKQGFKISLANRINKLQYNFNRRIHLLNKRQPAKPQTLQPVSHEILGRFSANFDATSNSSILSRGSEMSTALLETSIEVRNQNGTTLLPLAGPSINEWIGDVVSPIVPPFTPTTTLDFNTKQRELADAIFSTSPQVPRVFLNGPVNGEQAKLSSSNLTYENEYYYGSKARDQISPASSRQGQSPESSFSFSPVQRSPNSSFNSATNLRSPRYKIDAWSYTPPRRSSSSSSPPAITSPFHNTHSFATKSSKKIPSKRKSSSLPRIGRSSVVPIQTSRGLTKSESDDEKMKDWLEKLSLQQYTPILEEHEIDTETFLTLTNGDLDEIGIKQPDAQQQILTAVRQLRKRKERKPVLMKAQAW